MWAWKLVLGNWHLQLLSEWHIDQYVVWRGQWNERQGLCFRDFLEHEVREPA